MVHTISVYHIITINITITTTEPHHMQRVRMQPIATDRVVWSECIVRSNLLTEHQHTTMVTIVRLPTL